MVAGRARRIAGVSDASHVSSATPGRERPGDAAARPAWRAVAAPGPRTVAFARHGETADNAGGRVLGRRDPPLSERGRGQALALAEQALDWGLGSLWCSPLGRAHETARIVGERVGLRPRVLDAFAESRRGAWEGRRHVELRDDDPGLYRAFVEGHDDFAFPGGESFAAQVERTREALEAVRRGELPALVVAHAGTIRSVLALAGAPVPAEHALIHGAVGAVVAPGGEGSS